MDDIGPGMIKILYPNHANLLRDGLYSCLLSRNGVDFNLRFGGRSISAHRIVLELFIAPDKLLAAHEPCDDHQYGRGSMDSILELLYKGEVVLPVEKLDNFLEIINRLDLNIGSDTESMEEMVSNAVESTSAFVIIEDGAGDCDGSMSLGDDETVDPELCVKPHAEVIVVQATQGLEKPADDFRDMDNANLEALASLVLERDEIGKRGEVLGLGDNSEVGKSILGPEDVFEPHHNAWRVAGKARLTEKTKAGGGGRSQNSEKQPENILKCQTCNDFQTSSNRLYAAHTWRCQGWTTGKSDSGPTKRVPRPTSAERPKNAFTFKCMFCDFQTTDKREYQSHVREGHDVENPALSYKCPECSFTALAPHLLQIHVDESHSQTVEPPTALVDIGEDGESILVPLIEGYQNAETAEPANNGQAMAEKKDNFKCAHCEYRSNTQSYVARHIKIVHGIGPDIFTCVKCGRRFVSRILLETHSRSHANKRKFACPKCHYSSSTRKSLRQHALLRHKLRIATKDLPTTDDGLQVPEEQTAFRCKSCPFESRKKDNLARHQNIVHGLGVNRFTCKICGKRCPSRFDLVKHSRGHSGERPFKCSSCPYSATTKSCLKQHQINRHGSKPTEEEKIFKCESCSFRTDKKQNLQKHELVIHGVGADLFTCETCGKICLSLAKLTEHIRKHTGERPFQCTSCPYSAATKDNLKQHQHVKHDHGPAEEVKIFRCQHCPFRSRRKESLERHENVAHEVGPNRFTCEICGRRCVSRGNLEKHVRSHSQIKSCQCPICPFLTHDTYLLKNHVRRRHNMALVAVPQDAKRGKQSSKIGEPSTSVDERLNIEEQPAKVGDCHSTNITEQAPPVFIVKSLPPAKTKKRMHPCELCDYECDDSSRLRRHQDVVHGVGVNRHTCPTCAKRCPSAFELKIHLRTHTREKPFKCPACPHASNRKDTLASHVQKKHGLTLPADLYPSSKWQPGMLPPKRKVPSKIDKNDKDRFRCDVCGQRCHSRCHMVAHRRIHTAEKPFHCDVCGRSFREPQLLKRHMEAIHGGGRVKKFACPKCDKRFNSAFLVKEHSIIHTGERPFKCPHCTHACNKKSLLTRHIQNLHVNKSPSSRRAKSK